MFRRSNLWKRKSANETGHADERGDLAGNHAPEKLPARRSPGDTWPSASRHEAENPGGRKPYVPNRIDHIKRYLEAQTETLDVEERIVLALYFGLNGERPHTLAEIGDRLEVSREQVLAIKESALKHMD